ncbi:MAG: phosphate ABC transporter permease subunit PstC [Nitrospirota bacterium]|nr:phosphate ABC transporter permease subunit PstC [Nitrospirota bacterium]
MHGQPKSTTLLPSITLPLHLPDRLLTGVLWCSASLSGLVLFSILAFLFAESIPALQHIGIERLTTDRAWHPTDGQFFILPVIVGTLLTATGALFLATPLAILSAIFCHWYAPPPIAFFYRRLIELLAGIPSVVYGLWGLVVLVPLIGETHPPGSSLLAGIIILAIMVLPTIALLAQGSIANVPQEFIRGGAALGLGRWAILRGIVLPSAKSGLFTAILLGTGRAVGETMAVLMVCGNIVQIPEHIFEPVRTLTANIALEMAYAMDDHRSTLFVSGLILMGMVLVLVNLAEWFSRVKIYE